jgi:hypothetical protein
MGIRDALSFDTKTFGPILLSLPPLPLDELVVTGESRRARRASKRALLAQKQRWQLWVSQNVPLRDEAALLDYARRLVFRDREGRHQPASARADWLTRPIQLSALSEKLSQMAGGALPVGFEPKMMKVVHKLRSEAEAKQNKRAAEKRKEGKTPVGRYESKPMDRVREALQNAASAAMRTAKFTHGPDRIDFDTSHPFTYTSEGCHVQRRDTSHIYYASKRITSRRRRNEVMFSTSIKWLNVVGSKGRANLFGERTLVLDWVEVPDKGVTVTLARQKSEKRYTIETVRGQYSLDADSKPKLVDEVVLSVSKKTEAVRE